MMTTKKTLLIITDGIGHKPNSPLNAFKDAKKPAYDRLFRQLPGSLLNTHSLSVGLPEGQMGNSEVGHLTIGAGRVLYQDLVRISKAIESGELTKNPHFQVLASGGDRVHLLGLLSDGGVHSHIDHLIGLIKLFQGQKKRIFLHLLTDGRDVSPTASPGYLKQLLPHLDDRTTIATIGGRYYGMDRDHRWERVERSYKAIVEATPRADCDPLTYVQRQHEAGVTDEFLEPVAFGDYAGLEADDGLLCFNFRSDRMRQITQLLGDADFKPIAVVKKPLRIVTMTEYNKTFPYPILFTKAAPESTLAEVISKAGLRQFHTAETEKYAHVTFFLNGGIEEPWPGESRVLIPSPKVATYDLQPEMSADAVGDAVLKAIEEEYDFIVVNFANGDMVGHTGNYEAAIKAVEAVDRNLGRLVDAADRAGYSYLITSDHGNCEEMADKEGRMLTNHTVGEVFCFVKADGVSAIQNGGLSNVAPSILKMMNLPIPPVMDQPLF
jgi:2,3-bisphosphoglycerate-independent phosphoglycerate mutase